MNPLYDFLHRPFGGFATTTTAIPSEPLSIKKLKQAQRILQKVQNSNTFIELLKNLESVIKQ
jgi:hypothetical protein